MKEEKAKLGYTWKDTKEDQMRKGKHTIDVEPDIFQRNVLCIRRLSKSDVWNRGRALGKKSRSNDGFDVLNQLPESVIAQPVRQRVYSVLREEGKAGTSHLKKEIQRGREWNIEYSGSIPSWSDAWE